MNKTPTMYHLHSLLVVILLFPLLGVVLADHFCCISFENNQWRSSCQPDRCSHKDESSFEKIVDNCDECYSSVFSNTQRNKRLTYPVEWWPEGKLRLFLRATFQPKDSAFDWNNVFNDTYSAFFNSRYTVMVVNEPKFHEFNEFDWFTNDAYFYKDGYGIRTNLTLNRDNASIDWVLRDKDGRLCYIPFAVSADSPYEQYAGDIGKAEFRNNWINYSLSLFSKAPYAGVFMDDVNLGRAVVCGENGEGNSTLPVDSTTGKTMTDLAWRKLYAEFIEEIVARFPVDKRIIINCAWYAVNNFSDPYLLRVFQAASFIYNEQGFIGPTQPHHWHEKMQFVDIVHSLGKSVILNDDEAVDADIVYAVAHYLLINNGHDFYSAFYKNRPYSYWYGYSCDIGKAKGPKYPWVDQLWRRDFEAGIVIVNPVGGGTITLHFEHNYTNLDNTTVHGAVTLPGRSALVLQYDASCVECADLSNAASVKEVIFDDALGNGWTGFSPNPYNTMTFQPYSGKYAIKFEPDFYDTLHFNCQNCIDTSRHELLEFWVRGGVEGEQKLHINFLKYNGVKTLIVGKNISLNAVLSTQQIVARKWVKGIVNITKWFPAGVYDWFWFRDSSGTNQSIVYFDDIALIRRRNVPDISIVVYDNKLNSTWQDKSTSVHRLNLKNPSRSWPAGISYEADNLTTLFFYCSKCLNTSEHQGIEFWVNGGSLGGQNIQFDMIRFVNGTGKVIGPTRSVTSLVGVDPIPKNKWHKGFATFPYKGTYDGFWFKDNTNTNQPTIYIDDIRVLKK